MTNRSWGRPVALVVGVLAWAMACAEPDMGTDATRDGEPAVHMV
jgi:hypothetical protein